MTTEQVIDKVLSSDGTPIAFWRSGGGRPLVLVHGTTADHSRWQSVRGLLEDHATLCAVDRRGRGESGDAEDYDLGREVEDVVAVVDAIADEWGGPVDLLGHSYGAFIALDAARRTPNLRRLVLYEAPVVMADAVYPAGFAPQIESLLAEGRRDEVVALFFREVVRMPEDQLTAFRQLPAWPARVAAAHTIVREARATTSFRWDPESYAGLSVPVLLLSGSTSPEFLRTATAAQADALPDVRVTVLEGQAHTAMDTAPELFADAVISFLSEE